MKNRILAASVLVSASLVLGLQSYAAKTLVRSTPLEIATAKVTSALAQGTIPKSNALVFVMFTDLGDGSAPVVVLEQPQNLSGAASDAISFAKSAAGMSFNGTLAAITGHPNMKHLIGALTAQASPTHNLSGKISSNLTKGLLTPISGGQSTVVDAAGKRTINNTQIFAYYD